jgi:hypothetical protein
MENLSKVVSRFVPLALLPIAAAAKVKIGYLVGSRALERHIQNCRAGSVDLTKWGYRVFSQHGEDGVLAAITERTGIGPRKFVEFGFGPIQNNTLAFALRNRACGLYLDGSERNCAIARRMLSLIGQLDISVTRAWVDAANIDRLIVESLGAGEIDVLSIDVDGNDYWLWQAIKSISPRIVITEYNSSFGPDRTVTVPYDPHFERHKKHVSGLYHGMSLRAAAKLGTSKGYALVGCDRDGVNAFFVRRDLLAKGLSEVPVESAFQQHQNRLSRGLSQETQEAIAYSLAVVEV